MITHTGESLAIHAGVMSGNTAHNSVLVIKKHALRSLEWCDSTATSKPILRGDQYVINELPKGWIVNPPLSSRANGTFCCIEKKFKIGARV